eukprot:2743654-Rhodomonas_salina.1
MLPARATPHVGARRNQTLSRYKVYGERGCAQLTSRAGEIKADSLRAWYKVYGARAFSALISHLAPPRTLLGPLQLLCVHSSARSKAKANAPGTKRAERAANAVDFAVRSACL